METNIRLIVKKCKNIKKDIYIGSKNVLLVFINNVNK